jgi:hypothetical protein
MFNILSGKRTELTPEATFQSVRFRHKLFIRGLGETLRANSDLVFDEFDHSDTVPVNAANPYRARFAIRMPLNGSFPAKDSWRNTCRFVTEKIGCATQGGDAVTSGSSVKWTSKFTAPCHLN